MHDEEGEFDVLATPRRSGEPFELTPGEITASTMVSSGAITKRVDRCVTQGRVARRVSADDARGRVVSLTPQVATSSTGPSPPTSPTSTGSSPRSTRTSAQRSRGCWRSGRGIGA